MDVSSEQAMQVMGRITESSETDILLFNAPFERGNDHHLINLLGQRKRRKNVLLVLTSSGGDADAAYRIARSLQDNYEKFTAFVPGWCKSAGTLCVLGANEVVISDSGELGPLDVQLRRRDEIDEYGSGLAVTESLSQVRQQTFHAFESYMLDIKQRSLNAISFKLAAELAARMAVQLYEPISRQIDPVQIGDQARAMMIARDYGIRLQIASENFSVETLDLLVESYPSHGFVIDRREACHIFFNVRGPTEDEQTLANLIGNDAIYPSEKSLISFIYPERECQHEDPTHIAVEEQGAPGELQVERPAEERGGGDAGHPAEAANEDETQRHEVVSII